jgi:hypothetical protein
MNRKSGPSHSPPPLVALAGRHGEWRRGRNGVGALDLVAVQADDIFGRLVGADVPGPNSAVRSHSEEVERFAAEDAAEPVMLDVQGEMVHETEAAPSRGQHRTPELFFGKTGQGAQHVLSLIGQRAQERAGLFHRREFRAHLSVATWLLRAWCGCRVRTSQYGRGHYGHSDHGN